MYKKDFRRFKAKVYHKLRCLYVSRFQNGKKNLSFYRACRKYARQNGRYSIDKKCRYYLTKIVNPSAGIGDQLASWITGYYYAGVFGVHYAYSFLYPKKWNDFFGFYRNEITVRELCSKRGYKKVWLPHFDENNPNDIAWIKEIMESYNNKKTVFYLEVDQVYTEQTGVMEDIKKKFREAAARQGEKLIYDREKLNIALHIRRGDITEGQKTNNPSLTFRWLNNDYYVSVLDKVLEMCRDKTVELYIFSQGKKEDFPELYKYRNINWCMDMSATASFLHMVRADILITSKSSFSYNPALLSDGIKICPQNFWHSYPDSRKWILADDEGSFDILKLQAVMAERIINLEKCIGVG